MPPDIRGAAPFHCTAAAGYGTPVFRTSMESRLSAKLLPRWSRAVAIGECMVEMAPAEGGGYAMGFAGDTFNTAWYLHRLAGPGLAVDYLTATGTDAVSDRMVRFMSEAGIGTATVARLPDATVGLYLVTLDGAERSFSYWRSASAARQLGAHLAPLGTAGTGTLLYLSGITFAILPEADRERLLSIAMAARSRGATLAFDPNIRPRLWDGPEAMRHWIEAAAAASDLVFPSADDEATAFGDAGPEATAERYLRLGAGTVVVKDGARPVLVRGAGGETAEVRPETVTPVDTTAAGDAFNAGYLAALQRGDAPGEAARAGCHVAARVVQGRGALVPI